MRGWRWRERRWWRRGKERKEGRQEGGKLKLTFVLLVCFLPLRQPSLLEDLKSVVDSFEVCFDLQIPQTRKR